MLDVIISDAKIIDGSGSPGWKADIGIQGDKILAIGDLSNVISSSHIKAENQTICPGFIDVHTHSDLTPFIDNRCLSKIMQGVTTEVVGNCGFSAFPLVHSFGQKNNELNRAIFMANNINADWSDCAGYLNAIEKVRPTLNIASLVGNATIRAAVMGYQSRDPNKDDFKAMRRYVVESVEQGAIGLSTGLTLYPSSLAQRSEIINLCKIAAKNGGIYTTHTRHKANWHFKSVEEAIEIGKKSGIRVQISHLAIIDPHFWGQADRLIELIEQASISGLDVGFDAYPYLAAGCPFSEALPEWVQEGGTDVMLSRLKSSEVRKIVLSEAKFNWFSGILVPWGKVIITSSGPFGNKDWIGKSVSGLAKSFNCTDEEMMLDIIIQSEDIGMMVVHNRMQNDVDRFVTYQTSSIGSDGIAISPDQPWGEYSVHPRFYGTFPRILSHYVRERRMISLEQAIHKMTGLPALQFNLYGRGGLKEGYFADLVIFNPKTVQDNATFESPHLFPTGISHVMVNGQWTVFDGKLTSSRAGRALRPSVNNR